MAVNIKKFNQPLVYNYGYDQLNRLVNMDSYKGWNGKGIFAPEKINDYHEKINYDGNGNIITYKRNGDAARQSMDDMIYSYKPNTNQLDKVSDEASDVAAGDYDKYNDIKQRQHNGNYTYDAIGNLIKDKAENIENIQWNACPVAKQFGVYGKIQSISKTATTKGDVQNIHYEYDATGNRIGKIVKKKGIGASDYT